MGLSGGGERKVVIGFMLVARKHAKAARTEETNNSHCWEGGLQRGVLHWNGNLAAVSSNVSRPENGL